MIFKYLPHKFDLKNNPAVKLYCESVLNYLSTLNNHEEVTIIDKGGNVYHIVGEKYNVRVPEGLLKSATIDLHNHPAEARGAFSKQDIQNSAVGTEHYLTDGENVYYAKIKQKVVFESDSYAKSIDVAASMGEETADDNHKMCLYLKSKGVIDYEKVERHPRV